MPTIPVPPWAEDLLSEERWSRNALLCPVSIRQLSNEHQRGYRDGLTLESRGDVSSGAGGSIVQSMNLSKNSLRSFARRPWKMEVSKEVHVTASLHRDI